MSVRKVIKWALIAVTGVVIYLATAMPVGLFLYSMKSRYGINLFEKTGFHDYLHCLQSAAEKMLEQADE